MVVGVDLDLLIVVESYEYLLMFGGIVVKVVL